jgi:hypothetical protein
LGLAPGDDFGVAHFVTEDATACDVATLGTDFCTPAVVLLKGFPAVAAGCCDDLGINTILIHALTRASYLISAVANVKNAKSK